MIVGGCSYYISKEGRLMLPRGYPIPNKNKGKFKEVFAHQLRFFRYNHKTEIPKDYDLTFEEYFSESAIQTRPVTDNYVKELNSKEDTVNEFDEIKVRDNFASLGSEYVNRANTLIKKDEDCLQNPGGKVYVFPSLQIPPIKFYEDEEVLCEVLKTAAQHCKRIKLASGYLNLPKSFSERLFKAKCPIELMAASPKANGFYESGFFKRWIPIFYRCFEYYLLKDLEANVTLNEYIKENWTYHGKGSWFYEEDNKPSLTVIGSSNYGIYIN